MDLRQTKLTKDEWDFLEKPIPQSEIEILQLIKDARKNINVSFNKSLTLGSFMKLENNDDFHTHLYDLYFKKKIDKLNKKYNIDFSIQKKKNATLKKKDLIRITNGSKKISESIDLYEYLLIKNVELFLKSSKPENLKYYYTLTQLLKNNIYNINTFVLNYVKHILETKKREISIVNLIKRAYDCIERNDTMLKYNDVKLYPHQKELISTMNNEKSCLILYQAPTGTGKTLTPLGLNKKVIFVCAAKHIGLQLAKACISREIPIAVAFGCNDASDIRLHYYAAKDFVKNRKTGGIFRVDNSVGDKVEIIISDIQSYLYSMNYMLAFNEEKDIVWYWDEPTITLDYEEHEYHAILKKNWEKNRLSNIILSSATLPCEKDIFPMILNYKQKFPDSNKYEIISYECKKTIPILDSTGNIVMPHYNFDNVKELKKSVKFLESNKTILRHFDVTEISKFVSYVNKHNLVNERYNILNYFDEIGSIDIISLKLYYIKLLSKIKQKDYEQVRDYLIKKRKKEYDSTIKITTSDSYTLTDGPTIFLTNDVEKIAKFYLKVSNIPSRELNNINDIIEHNDILRKDIDKIVMEEEDRVNSKNEKSLDKNVKNNTEEYKLIMDYNKKLEKLKGQIIAVELNSKYIPNRKYHFKEWLKEKKYEKYEHKIFTSDVSEEVVEEIMMLSVNDEWKILLMMGIGVFLDQSEEKYNKDKNTKKNYKNYLDIMKKLAEEQKLYLIIASSDYIYGTNYQFCHGYLSKDLLNMTQEKMIQAFGRVGRRSPQKDYSIRLRDDTIINKLLNEEEDKIEVENMNELFGM